MFFLKSSEKSLLTIVHASSSAERDVKPFFMNLKIIFLFVSFAARIDYQLAIGCFA